MSDTPGSPFDDGFLPEGAQVMVEAVSDHRVTLVRRVIEIDQPFNTPGNVCVATYLREADGGERMLTRDERSPEAAEAILAYDPTAKGCHLRLIVRAEPDGSLLGLLTGIVPAAEHPSLLDELRADLAAEETASDEPWAASAGSNAFEQAMGTAGGHEALPPIEDLKLVVMLGSVRRVATARRFPDDLRAETADLLKRIEQGATVEVIDQIIGSMQL